MNRNENRGKDYALFAICSDKGFTLVELLIAMAIFGIVSAIIATFFSSFQRSNTVQMVSSDALQKARGAISFMSEEIKLAGLDPEESGNFNMVTATSTSLTFDFDSPDPTSPITPVFDGAVNLDSTRPAERITYRFATGRLERLENQGLSTSPALPPTVGEVIVPEIDAVNSGFTYLDSSGNPTAVINNIRSVQVDLSVLEDSGLGNKVSKNLSSRILVKNLIFNAQR